MKLMSNVRSRKSKKPDKTVLKKKRMQYSVEDFEKAVSAVTDDQKSIGSAAKECNVPSKTLSDRINGRHAKNVGRPTYLTEAQETFISESRLYDTTCFLLGSFFLVSTC